MTLYAYDGASPFDLSAAKAAGGILITGYIVGHPGGYDPITKDRVSQIRADGMGFLPNWEKGADYLVTCGMAGGARAGHEAVAAVSTLGVPQNGTVAIAFSWDCYIHPSQYAECGQVADGIIRGLGGKYLFSAYGQGGLLKYFAETGRLKVKGWLSSSTGFPGYDSTASYVGLVQEVGTNVPGTDRNHIITDPHNIGAWWPDGSPYGAQVPLTQADANLILHTPIKNPFTGQYQPFYDYVVGAYVDAVGAKAAAGAAAPVLADLVTRLASLQAEVDSLKQTANLQIKPLQVSGSLTVQETA